MLDTIIVKAPAKINIYLKVTSKRSDGFHNIESIFQKIPLFDELIIQEVSESNVCCVYCDELQLPKKNTLTSVYDEFIAVTGVRKGVSVRLTKRIPTGAGLGGGSSDAASFLCALNDIFKTDLDRATKQSIAAKIGSDVVFFLGSDCSIVTGRGEIIEEIPARRDLYFVLLTPDVHSSTKEAYALLDEWNLFLIEKSVLTLEDVKNMYVNDVQNWTFINSFTFPLIEHFPQIEQALSAIKKTGALFVEMSGSGSSVFGVYLSKVKAQNAKILLAQKWKHCWMLPSC